MANLNRLKVVLVEQQKTGKWLAEQILQDKANEIRAHPPYQGMVE